MKKLQVEDIIDVKDWHMLNSPHGGDLLRTVSNFTELYYAINDPVLLIWLYHQSNDTGDIGPLVQAVANCCNHIIDLVPFAACRDSILAAKQYDVNSNSFFDVPYESIHIWACRHFAHTEHSKNIINFSSGATGFVQGDDWQPHLVVEYAAKAYGHSGVMNYHSAAYFKRYYKIRNIFCDIIRDALPLNLWNTREPIA